MTDVAPHLPPAPLNVAVIVASTGRPESIATLLAHLARQSQPPCQIVLSVTTDADLPAALTSPGGPAEITVVDGPRGLPIQRNTGLNLVRADADVIAFFDDDYLPSHYCVERIARFFALHRDVVGANGHLLADGINSPGIATHNAEQLVRDYDAGPTPDYGVERDLIGLYGCNMTFRRSAIGPLRFDERLRLYGWQEDIDFATQINARGRIVKTAAFAGVHLGSKRGRTSGLRLGYSQVVNPLYLIRKGTMPPMFGVKLLARNVAANHLRLLRPEPWVDRAGRARGNWLGLVDALCGRLTPERIESL